MADIDKRIQNILENLEQVNEDLLALSDDIWLSIDHNDNIAIKELTIFKSTYNDQLNSFSSLSEKISVLIQDFSGTSPQHEEAEKIQRKENDRIVKKLDKNDEHYLAENLKYKKPYGFTFNGKVYNDVKSWRRVYQLFIKNLLDSRKTDVESLLSDKRFITKQEKRYFSSTGEGFHAPRKVTEGLFIETTLSANYLSERMMNILKAYNFSKKDVVLYLREDRDYQKDK